MRERRGPKPSQREQSAFQADWAVKAARAARRVERAVMAVQEAEG